MNYYYYYYHISRTLIINIYDLKNYIFLNSSLYNEYIDYFGLNIMHIVYKKKITLT